MDGIQIQLPAFVIRLFIQLACIPLLLSNMLRDRRSR